MQLLQSTSLARMGILVLVPILCCCLQMSAGRVARVTRFEVGRASPPAVTATATASSEEQDVIDDLVPAAALPNSEESEETDADENDDDDDVDVGVDVDVDVDGEKTAVQPSKASSLSLWGVVRELWDWLREDLSESFLGADAAVATVGAGRTFGKIRRLQMALIPIIFKFGVLSAMVAFLVVLGMKTLFLVKMLLLLNAAAILGKFLTLKTGLTYPEHHHSAPATYGYSNWSPHATGSWAPTAPAVPVAQPHPSKEIHLHIHGAQVQPHAQGYTASYGSGTQAHSGWERRSDPYAAYEPATTLVDRNGERERDSQAENELNNEGPLAMLPSRYPANHRRY